MTAPTPEQRDVLAEVLHRALINDGWQGHPEPLTDEDVLAISETTADAVLASPVLADMLAAARAEGYQQALEREPARLAVEGVPPGLADMIQRTARADALAEQAERVRAAVEDGAGDILVTAGYLEHRMVSADLVLAALSAPATEAGTDG